MGTGGTCREQGLTPTPRAHAEPTAAGTTGPGSLLREPDAPHDDVDQHDGAADRQDELVRLSSARDVLYAVSDDAVTVYDAADGSVRAAFNPDKRLLVDAPNVGDVTKFTAGPTPITGGVLVLSDDGRLWAIRKTILPGALEAAGGVGTLGLASYLGYRWLRSDATGD